MIISAIGLNTTVELVGMEMLGRAKSEMDGDFTLLKAVGKVRPYAGGKPDV